MGELTTNSGSNYGEYLELDQLAADESPIKNYEVNDSPIHGDLLKHFQSLVECPVCLGSIRTVPVFCCPSGHVVCTECR